MAHYYEPNIRPRQEQDEQRAGPVIINWVFPERIPTPPPRVPDQSYPTGLSNEQQPQDYNGTRAHERRQQFTYIPSTSSISSGRNYQPPWTSPFVPSFSPHVPGPGFIPPPPSVLPYVHGTFPSHISVQDSNNPHIIRTPHSRFDHPLKDTPSTPYTSVNPYKPPPLETPEYVVYAYWNPLTKIISLYNDLQRQVYSHFLLRLPMFYWSRVARIFEEAEMTMPEIEKMALQAMGSITIQQLQLTSPAGAKLKVTWEGFIDSLLREWKTLNIVSVLLLS